MKTFLAIIGAGLFITTTALALGPDFDCGSYPGDNPEIHLAVRALDSGGFMIYGIDAGSEFWRVGDLGRASDADLFIRWDGDVQSAPGYLKIKSDGPKVSLATFTLDSNTSSELYELTCH